VLNSFQLLEQEVRAFDIHLSVHRNIITNYSQQDVTSLEFIYFYKRSTCFRRFLCPSSGAHNCTYSFRYCQPILLLAATVDGMEHVIHGKDNLTTLPPLYEAGLEVWESQPTGTLRVCTGIGVPLPFK